MRTAYKRILSWCVAIFIVSAGGAFHCDAQVNAEQVMTIGRNVLSMDDYMLSIQYFNQAIKAKPYLSDPYYYRAVAKLYLDDYAGAEEDCTRAITRNKFKTEAYKLRGFVRQHLGKDSLAVEDYDVGLRYNPLDKFFLYYKGVALTQWRKFESADSVFRKLTRHYPNFEEGYAEMGRMNLLRGDTIAALESMDKALKMSRNMVNVYLMRADIRARKGEWGKALEDMNEAIRLEPQESDLYVNRAYLHYNLDNFFGAMSDYNYAIELDPSNSTAVYNRALLLAQVRDYINAYDAFSRVLELDPENFHALYNRALIALYQGENRKALRDFTEITGRYPRYYAAYYGIAQAKRNLGDMQGAMKAAYFAEDLIRKYVKNPRQNALDRPGIAMGSTQKKGETKPISGDGESETEVMERFNELVTVASTEPRNLSYNERIKGKVQDRDINVVAEGNFMLSITPPEISLKSRGAYFKELAELNSAPYILSTIYLRPEATYGGDENGYDKLFSKLTELDEIIKRNGRPIDYLTRGVVRGMLKDYVGSESDFSKAIELNPDFTVAYMGRGFVRQAMALAGTGIDAESDDARVMMQRARMQNAVNDYDAALMKDPRIAYAWYNKGNIYYSMGDYTSALSCYAEAIKLDNEFGQAFYNRGLTYLQIGNRTSAFNDLSKAGELGVIPSYNLLKRMKK